MRGEIISGEYQKMVWVHDKNGKEYACYVNDLKKNLKNKEDLSDEEKQQCLDLSQVVGESW
ncbi:MAG: hypothetical protein HKP41_14910 [Desulfobacterales bacterium]|nr:hypothetical protein [Deltaproteobacteria bacterium]NNK95639.1 hypothetical protein [Desulfobacterales bacterium]